MPAQRGVTLVELLVVLVILATMTAVVGLAFRREGWASATTTVPPRVAAVRRTAVSTGRAVRDSLHLQGRWVPILGLPDGRVLGGDSSTVRPSADSPDAPAFR